MTANKPDDIWIFGYGSLIWRPDFEFIEKRGASVEGWARRFWQGSHDHRGVPEAPGRVVTLVPQVGQFCVGMAFRVSKQAAAQVFTRLDYREKNGYERHEATLRFANGESATGIFYIASCDNFAWLGAAPLAEIAKQINAAHGPSGSNREYLLQLHEALSEMAANDNHVLELAMLVRPMAPSVPPGKM